MFFSVKKLNTIDAKSTITLSKTGSLGDEPIIDIKSVFKTLPSHIDTLILDNLDLPEVEAVIKALHKHKNINKVGLRRLQPKAARAAAYALPNYVTHVTLEDLNTEAAKAVAQALPGQVIASVDSLSDDAKKVFKEVDDKGYLLLEPPLLTEGHYVIGIPAINSSGDIYHVLSYLLLAEAQGYKLPKVLIQGCKSTVNASMDSFKQAQRSKRLADLIGFAEVVTIEEVVLQPMSDYQTEAENALKESCKGQTLINQKAVTSLLAQHARTDIFTTDIIRENILTRIDNNEPKILADIEKVKRIVNQQYETLSREYEKVRDNSKGIVLIHQRHSKEANDGQNFKRGVIEVIQDELTHQGFFRWTIYCGNNPSYKLPENSFDVFNSEELKKEFEREEEINRIPKYEWYSKIYHILLLNKLLELPKLKGMIGNTSGLLDMASFLGHNVLSVHNFIERLGGKYKNKYDSQEYRILSQYPFMSILAIITKETDDEFKQKIKEQFHFWLGGNLLHPSIYYHHYALMQFTPDEVKELQSYLPEDDWERIKELKPTENLDYKKLILTIDEVIELNNYLVEFVGEQAKELCAKLESMTRQLRQLPEQAPEECSGYFSDDGYEEFDWFDGFHKALSTMFEEPAPGLEDFQKQALTLVTKTTNNKRKWSFEKFNPNKHAKPDTDIQNSHMEDDADEIVNQSTLSTCRM
jgi:hypothetical protein